MGARINICYLCSPERQRKVGLYNKYGKDTLREKVGREQFSRITLSFYKYVQIADPESFRDKLYINWEAQGVLGRIYVACEGINAQLSVPQPNFTSFRKLIDKTDLIGQVPFKFAVQDADSSFLKLKIKVRDKILADGLNESAFDVTKTGKHLSAREFNEAMDKEGTIVVDMRNHYESEVGHFKGALCPPSDTFRDELPLVEKELKGMEDQKILLYCTGGIRCEKASSWLKHKGFQDVNQLSGGIIEYAKQVAEEGLNSKFIGKNFVFDERLGERISEDIISECHQCNEACDNHTNCANDDCHLLFIQCNKCRVNHNGCCSPQCQEIAALPIEEQRKLRKNQAERKNRNIYKSRLRPNLKELISTQQVQKK